MIAPAFAVLIATVCTTDWKCTTSTSAPMFAEDCRRERDALLDGTDGGEALRYNVRAVVACHGVKTYDL